MSRITVIGLDGRPLEEEIEHLLATASLVAGGERHLEMLGVPRDRAVVLEGDLSGGAKTASAVMCEDPYWRFCPF